jgi:hypothetical protein
LINFGTFWSFFPPKHVWSHCAQAAFCGHPLTIKNSATANGRANHRSTFRRRAKRGRRTRLRRRRPPEKWREKKKKRKQSPVFDAEAKLGLQIRFKSAPEHSWVWSGVGVAAVGPLTPPFGVVLTIFERQEEVLQNKVSVFLIS